MRIVHVVESLEIGGLERVVVDLAAEQVRAGHSVAVICLCLLGDLALEATQKKIVVFNAAKRDGIDLRALWRMRSFIRRFGPDVLHTHNAVAHYYAAMAGLLAGIAPTLNTRHGMGSWNASARREMLYRLAMTVTRYGVCVCYAAQNAFLERGILPKRKAVVVPNGIDTSRFEPQNVSGRERLAVESGSSCNR